MAIKAKTKSSTKKTSRKAVKKAPARQASPVNASMATPKSAAPFMPNPMSAMGSFSMPSSTNDAMKQWSDLFKQPNSFKMENMMNTPNFPQFEQFQSQMQSAANQYSSFLNEATSAAEKSRTSLTKGLEECSKTMASMMQSQMQRANENMRTLMACKSVNEFADVQNQIAKKSYEAMAAETAKLVEQVTKTVSAASSPMNDLTAAAMTKAKKSMAA